ncbi:MAG: GGDEF domain-containing protein [Gammaproteobacteria bacterium]|nr:MAG: GGDEF domain-containing protein [Gammaproteobacteria bacterium]
MTAEIPQRSRKRVSASIRFIDRFLSRQPTERLTGLLLGQIDTFNRINTTFGSEQSRKFCAEYTEMLRGIVPQGTPVIRLSGRRFAILVTADSTSEVADLATLISEKHQPQMQVDEESFMVDVAMGVAMHPIHASDANSLFRRADLALKSAWDGDLAFDVYQPDDTKAQASLWKLESDLKRAIIASDLDVYYQPKVDLLRHKVCGVEALARWKTPGGKTVSPEEFIPLAERCGMIAQLTWVVFDKVCEAVQAWRRFDEPFGMAVNVAPQAVNHSEFFDRLTALRDKLATLNIRLAIELTEDSLLQDDRESLSNLHKVRELDVDLAIDDFGKGYSSLNYLKLVPATELKLDKTFIETIHVDQTDQKIVKAVIDLAHALDMRVVAEGVDSDESIAMVRNLGCELAQGFGIAKPMPSDLVIAWVDDYSPRLSLADDTGTSKEFLVMGT